VSSAFASGKKALATCDVCGQVFLLKDLRRLVVNLKITATKACNSCWSPDHPQWLSGRYPIQDPQALREPRPDQSLGQIRAVPVVIYQGVAGGCQVGSVTVVTP
jgi:hypothetical protein